MDQAEVQKLIEAAVKTANAPLLERAIRGDARELAADVLAGISLAESSKSRVISDCLRDLPIKDGALDADAFRTRVTEAAKAEGAYVASLTGAGRVVGMGLSTVAADPVKLAESRKRAHEEETELREAEERTFGRLMPGRPDAAKAAAHKGVAA